MAAHQATSSLGFSRQEHWSGLPFPSPMRESEVAQSCLTFRTPWTAAHQAPPSVGFSRQEYWSGVLLPSPGLLALVDKSSIVYLEISTFLCGSEKPATNTEQANGINSALKDM